MKKKPPQLMQQNHRPNPTWCFYHQQFADLNWAPSSDAPSLIAANGSPIRCYGTRVLKILIMGRFYSWPFALDDVRHPLLAADFLANHGLLVDVAGKRLIDTGTCRTRPLRAGPGITPTYAALLQEFPDVFKPELQQSPGSLSKHGVYHHINTMGPPTHAKFRCLPPQKLKDAKRAFEDMERMGICKKASSPWASPLHMENGLIVRFDKCTFGTERVDFLGHQISAAGVKPTLTKVDAVKTFTNPTIIRHLQEFLGMVNYYHHFILNIAHILTPLNDVLKGKAKKLVWGPLQQSAFDRTKATLAEATTLGYYDDFAPLKLTTDASCVACGAVLEQIVNGYPQPLAFFSKKLKPAETRYSTFDREVLTVYLAARHFRYMLEGTPAPDSRFHEVFRCMVLSPTTTSGSHRRIQVALSATYRVRRTPSPTSSPGSKSTRSTRGSTTQTSP
ncbi:uncharacterized protein [Palaemon carinicauda]|uniref:uncharacterized protein n=1 Tax=Palaemon carinicauda TaxID=392227 RepID=UPI0035B69DEA